MHISYKTESKISSKNDQRQKKTKRKAKHLLTFSRIIAGQAFHTQRYLIRPKDSPAIVRSPDAITIGQKR